MLIKQLSNYPRQDCDAGAVIDWPEAEAKRMIAANLVLAVADPETVPAATPRPTNERTTARKATETRG